MDFKVSHDVLHRTVIPMGDAKVVFIHFQTFRRQTPTSVSPIVSYMNHFINWLAGQPGVALAFALHAEVCRFAIAPPAFSLLIT